VIFPSIHLSGTSKERLLEAIEEAYHAITVAQEKLAETAPNGRDYYPQGGQALNQATDEHIRRTQKLEDVKRELQRLAEHIDGVQS
jgi:hypothetical protein